MGGPVTRWGNSAFCYAMLCYAESLQSCPTLCDPMDGSPPGSPVPGILQASTLEWVAISFSNAWKWKVKAKSLSRVRLLVTPWTAAHQAPPSMGFSRQKYWSGVPLPSPNSALYWWSKEDPFLSLWAILYYVWPPRWLDILGRTGWAGGLWFFAILSKKGANYAVCGCH